MCWYNPPLFKDIKKCLAALDEGVGSALCKSRLMLVLIPTGNGATQVFSNSIRLKCFMQSGGKADRCHLWCPTSFFFVLMSLVRNTAQ